MDFINENAGVFSLIFSAVVAISTIVYSALTALLVVETRNLRRAQTEPRVSVSLRPRHEWVNWIDLVVQNIGSGAAHEVKFEVTGMPLHYTNKLLAGVSFLNRGLTFLAPGQTISFYFENLAEETEKKEKISFQINVRYLDVTGRSYSEAFLIDFAQFIGITQLGEPELYRIAKNSEKIEKSIQSLATSAENLRRWLRDRFESDDPEKA